MDGLVLMCQSDATVKRACLFFTDCLLSCASAAAPASTSVVLGCIVTDLQSLAICVF